MKQNLALSTFLLVFASIGLAQPYSPAPAVSNETTRTYEEADSTTVRNETDYLADAIEMPEGVEHAEELPEIKEKFEPATSITANFRSRFNSTWPRCGNGCRPVNPWIAGDKRHCAKSSCHNSMQAADVHTISCGGTIHKAGSAKFNQIAVCMKRHARVLWKVKDHYHHFHVEFPGCYKKLGCRR